MSEDDVVAVYLRLCRRCLGGAGGECHTPGCALWMNRAPDVPITSFAYVLDTTGCLDEPPGDEAGQGR
jgi:hypothetical protein